MLLEHLEKRDRTLPVASSLCIACHVSVTGTVKSIWPCNAPARSSREGFMSGFEKETGQCITASPVSNQPCNKIDMHGKMAQTVKVDVVKPKLFKREVNVRFNIFWMVKRVPKLVNALLLSDTWRQENNS